MNSRILGWVVAAVAVAALFVVLIVPRSEREKAVASSSSSGDTHNQETVQGDVEMPPDETVLSSSATKDDVDQLPSDTRKMKGLVELAGRAARAENGFEVSCDFYYVTEVMYESHIVDRNVTSAGEVRVVETRRYEQCQDQITYGDFDVKTDLSTLPIRQVAPLVAGIADMVCGLFGAPPGTGAELVASGVKCLYSIDGMSAKKSLSLLSGLFGEETPKDAGAWVNRLVSPEVKRIHAEVKQAIQTISGKTYIVTYYQSATGEPMRVKFEREDKQPLSMEEYDVLREMNVFLSCHVIPSNGPAVGESWDVDVSELPGMFDSFSGGNKIKGTLRATRLPDESDGLWKVDLSGGRVAVLNDNGMEDGSFRINSGAALASPEDRQIRVLEMTGQGKLRIEEKKKRFILLTFLKRTTGDCQVRVTMATDIAK